MQTTTKAPWEDTGRVSGSSPKPLKGEHGANNAGQGDLIKEKPFQCLNNNRILFELPLLSKWRPGFHPPLRQAHQHKHRPPGAFEWAQRPRPRARRESEGDSHVPRAFLGARGSPRVLASRHARPRAGIATRGSDRVAQKVEARLALEPGRSHKGRVSRAAERGARESSEPGSSGATWGAWGRFLPGCCPFKYPGGAGERGDQDPCALRPARKGLGGAPHPLGTTEGAGGGDEMRGTCQNSLLTAKVTTLFPGP